jgi:hypothetical protein
MVNQQYAGESETFVRRYDYEDEWVIAADVGDGDLDVDIVDGTAIVVVDGETEAELDLPGSVERVDTNNGVLEVRGA